ncbi:MAG: hypothetical protein Q4G43_11300 [Mobilicoccus sp.]|nr:hypothetical protein [Mobilicoccus sp.]
MVLFPTARFTIEDDPDVLRASARSYRTFADQARAAQDALAGAAAPSWTGAEGDAYRARVTDDAAFLTAAADSFDTIGAKVSGFADELTELRTRMDELRTRAEGVWAAGPAPLTGLQEQQECLRSADRIRQEVQQAAQRTATSIAAIPQTPGQPSVLAALAGRLLDGAMTANSWKGVIESGVIFPTNLALKGMGKDAQIPDMGEGAKKWQKRARAEAERARGILDRADSKLRFDEQLLQQMADRGMHSERERLHAEYLSDKSLMPTKESHARWAKQVSEVADAVAPAVRVVNAVATPLSIVDSVHTLVDPHADGWVGVADRAMAAGDVALTAVVLAGASGGAVTFGVGVVGAYFAGRYLYDNVPWVRDKVDRGAAAVKRTFAAGADRGRTMADQAMKQTTKAAGDMRTAATQAWEARFDTAQAAQDGVTSVIDGSVDRATEWSRELQENAWAKVKEVF